MDVEAYPAHAKAQSRGTTAGGVGGEVRGGPFSHWSRPTVMTAGTRCHNLPLAQKTARRIRSSRGAVVRSRSRVKWLAEIGRSVNGPWLSIVGMGTLRSNYSMLGG